MNPSTGRLSRLSSAVAVGLAGAVSFGAPAVAALAVAGSSRIGPEIATVATHLGVTSTLSDLAWPGTLSIPWAVSWQDASASGRLTTRQAPLGIMVTTELDGSISVPQSRPCHQLLVRTGSSERTIGPQVCGGSTQAFTAGFTTVGVVRPTTLALCAVAPTDADIVDCGPELKLY